MKPLTPNEWEFLYQLLSGVESPVVPADPVALQLKVKDNYVLAVRRDLLNRSKGIKFPDPQ